MNVAGVSKMFNHRRSDVEVAADILRIMGSKTAILYGANLSYTQAQKYIRRLGELSLIESVQTGKGRSQYRPTQKGQEFLGLVERLEALVLSPTDSRSSQWQSAELPNGASPGLMPEAKSHEVTWSWFENNGKGKRGGRCTGEF